MQSHPFGRVHTLSAVLMIGLAVQTVSAQISIADPSVCLDDIECAQNKYCKRSIEDSSYGRCAARRALAQSCERTGDCVANAFCLQERNQRCVARAKLGEGCNAIQSDTCVHGLTCVPSTPNGPVGTCKPPAARGRLDAKCVYDRDCDQEGGFYCRNAVGRCTRKKPDGAVCNLVSDNYECQGFCATSGIFFGAGVCTPAQPLGAICFRDSDCMRPFEAAQSVDGARGDRIFCNKPRGEDVTGVCAKPSQLLRRLGAPCHRAHDLCDARRGLSCRWASHLRRTVCQQKYDRLARMRFTFVPCTRGSRFSSCPGPSQFFPTECRKLRDVPGRSSRGVDKSNLTFCLKRRAIVPDGSECSIEHHTCAPGSACRIVTGVALTEAYERFGKPSAVYCVKELPLGAKCLQKDKFRTACAPGLSCRNSTCVKNPQTPPSGQPNTHAYEGGSCRTLPCSPGFFCGSNKICRRQALKPVGFGQLCYDIFGQPQNCKKGLVCRTRWGIYGLTQCLFPQGKGAYCQSDEWCAGKLRCPAEVTAGREAVESRCYDPANALGLGQKCVAAKLRFGPRCLTTPNGKPGEGMPPFTLPLRCLPKKDGSSACQVEVKPFEPCDFKKQRVCADKRFVCRKGVCLPRK